jgi:hypothetical protein
MTNYNEISDKDARIEIMNQVGQKTYEEHQGEIISPSDVLYFLDAFGHFSLAINCQGLPKDLPDRVIEAVHEFDVYNDWMGKVTEKNCPLCSRTLYDFDFDSIKVVIDEYGDYHDRPEYVSDVAGYYWDATEEHDIICQACHEHGEFPGWQPEPSSNTVRIFYGADDEFTRFSHQCGIIRWDMMWDDSEKSTDIHNIRESSGELIKGHEIAASFAKGSMERDVRMNQIGFKKVNIKEIDQTVPGFRKFWRFAKEVLEGWATLDSKTMVKEPTHPDLDFTYIIEGTEQAWVPKEHYDKFKAELVWQSLREANKFEQANQYRDEQDALLDGCYYPVA